MVKQYECLLLNMGWAVEDIYAHYEDNGLRVWEFLPADGKIWLADKSLPRPTTIPIGGVYG